MGKGGKYLSKKAPAAKKQKKGKKKVLMIVLVVLLLLIVVGIIGGVVYYNYLINLISRPDDIVAPTNYADIGTMPTIPPEIIVDETGEASTTATASTEETWPTVVSDQNITNIMLVGQAAREGEEHLIADTMILCSINRETKTLTMTSLMRDLRLVWPEYIDINGKPHTGNNRINMAYNMGYRWAGNNSKGGMDVLAGIVEYNFGVKVDHTIEVNFNTFQQVMEMMEGVTVTINQEEIDYLQKNYPESNTAKTLEPGVVRLSPYLALGYARMRKVGHGDFERTERQRKVITSMLWELAHMNIFEINKMFTTLLPSIVTDMTNEQITNYALEFIPMIKDIKIQSQRIPFDGTYSSKMFEIEGQQDYQLVCDAAKNGEMLRESLGMAGVAVADMDKAAEQYLAGTAE